MQRDAGHHLWLDVPLQHPVDEAHQAPAALAHLKGPGEVAVMQGLEGDGEHRAGGGPDAHVLGTGGQADGGPEGAEQAGDVQVLDEVGGQAGGCSPLAPRQGQGEVCEEAVAKDAGPSQLLLPRSQERQAGVQLLLKFKGQLGVQGALGHGEVGQAEDAPCAVVYLPREAAVLVHAIPGEQLAVQ